MDIGVLIFVFGSGLIICLLILAITVAINIFAKGFNLRNNPTNENIKRFTCFARRLYIMPDNPIIWGSLRKTYHSVSENESIDFDLRVKLFEVLKRRGVIGLYYPRSNKNPMGLEKKLDELKRLRKKGKITEEEYIKSRNVTINNL